MGWWVFARFRVFPSSKREAIFHHHNNEAFPTTTVCAHVFCSLVVSFFFLSHLPFRTCSYSFSHSLPLWCLDDFYISSQFLPLFWSTIHLLATVKS
jgi:hypothetical protein